MYDLIGDIHGHATELRLLLEQMGYLQDNHGIYGHPEGRQVIFVGDLIDRGPEIRQVLEIVKPMVDHGRALCIMGNHEYNAICFWNRSEPESHLAGDYYRKHSVANIIQHSATVKAFQNREKEWEMYVDWFWTLPVFLDLPGLRVVHACWRPALKDNMKDMKQESSNRITYWSLGRPSQELLETMKGVDLKLPEGYSYHDKDGNLRKKCRTLWWKNPKGLTYRDYGETAVHDYLPDLPLPQTVIDSEIGYPESDKPVFFGHFWLRGQPKLQAPNVCCLDYSVAKGDKLVAYRWNGEQVLSEKNFCWVGSV